jgi:hypothetical protein
VASLGLMVALAAWQGGRRGEGPRGPPATGEVSQYQGGRERRQGCEEGFCFILEGRARRQEGEPCLASVRRFLGSSAG